MQEKRSSNVSLPGKCCFFKVRVLEVDICTLARIEIGLLEITVTERDILQDCVDEIGIVEVGIVEIAILCVYPDEIRMEYI
jgi:hypothetical protein